MLKKLLVLALILCLTVCGQAEDAYVYTQESVTDCASTGVKYDAFYAAGELSHVVPGLKQDFVPQGLTYLPAEGLFLIAGYSGAEGVNSVIFAVDASTGSMVKDVRLLQTDGSAYTGHAGGVAATEKNLFISNNEHLYRISLEKFLATPAGGSCAFDEAIPVPSRASYCGYADGVLWVGEFQYTGYNTDRSHYYKTEDGRHKAWLIGYKLDETQPNELRPLSGGVAVPDYVLTTTERIQGMTVKDGSVYLSQSYGRRNSSELLKYRLPIGDAPAAHVEIGGVQVPLWTLTSSIQEGRMVMPPMSECLVTVDGAVYVVFESATLKYMTPGNASVNPMDRLFKLTGF